MEFMTLDGEFQPKTLIDNFESLIWTERYSTNGDFEVQSSDIKFLFNALPLETFVGLRDSTVPMIVETVKIRKPPREAPMITVTGRSVETVLDRRASVNDLDVDSARTQWFVTATKEADAAYLAMRTVLGDIARLQEGVEVLAAQAPAVSALDAIPELTLTLPADYVKPAAYNAATAYAAGDFVIFGSDVWQAQLASTGQEPTSSSTVYWVKIAFEIKPQNLYNTVIELINTNHRGLKAVRPDMNGNQVGIEIYNGADLTETIQFDAHFDQFDDASYLFSYSGSTNVGYVYGSNGAQIVLKNAWAPYSTIQYNIATAYAPGDFAWTSSDGGVTKVYWQALEPTTGVTPVEGTNWREVPREPSGLSRRVLVLDLSTDSAVNTSEIRKQRGLIELYKYNATALFDGETAIQVAAGFNTDYFLGDILMLNGEYDLSQKVRVAEFIRTADAQGEKAYPAFEAVDD